MAIALKIGILYLLAKLSAHTFVVLGVLASAGAIAACALKSFLDRLYYLCVLVKSYLHITYARR